MKMAKDNEPNRDLLQVLEIFFLVLLGVGALLWFMSPTKTLPQLLFRLGVSFVGIVGAVVVQVIKFTRKK